MEKDVFLVEGYHFNSLADAELAKEELKKAEYFEGRITGRSAQNLMTVYDKVLDEKVFITPVGWEYLKILQQKLREAGVPEENIRPIPMYQSFKYRVSDEVSAYAVPQRIRPAKKKKEVDKFQISVIANIFLAILVLAMFIVTLKSDNPNIINYKRTLVNQYASWDQELTEREQAIREKERELNIFTEENSETKNQ